MKNKLILSITLFAFIFSLALVSANANQDNYVRYGIIENDGTTTNTGPALNSNVLGVVCNSASCSTISSTLFGPTNIPTSMINLSFPSVLASPFGYGLYFYKTGYIPYGVSSTWAGDYPVPDGIRNLTQKRTCTVPISSPDVSYSGGNITINTTVTSPINKSGPLNYIPPSIADQFTVGVQVNFSISGSMNYSETRIIPLNFSSSSPQLFSKSLGAGSYNLVITANSSDSKCINSPLTTQTATWTITPPAPTMTSSISNLQAITRTNISLIWSWTNPSDVLFNGTILFLDGNNVANLSSLITSYSNSSFLPSTTHNLTILTIGTNGIINTTGVTNITSTLSNSIPVPDTTPPSSVTGLHLINATNTTLLWSWTNPIDLDFNSTIILINGTNIINLSAPTNQYLATGLIPNSTYIITVLTKDNSGNVNNTPVNNPGSTLANNAPVDTTPPLVTIFSPQNITYNISSIMFNVSLNEPGNVNFTLDNGLSNFSMNSLNNINFTYLYSGLANGSYTFRAYARDLAGNTNNTEKLIFSVVNSSFSGNNSSNATNITGRIINLQAITRTNYSLIWTWTNPIADTLFNGTILFLDGNNVANLSSLITSYSNSSFSPNTTHNLTILTIGTNGIINTTGVTNITSTLSNSNNNNNDNNHNSNNYNITYYSGNSHSPNYFSYGADNGTIVLGSSTSKASTPFSISWQLVLLLVLGILLIMILILTLLITRR